MGRPTQTFPTRENRRNFIIMKKETIFKHELNESIQATAAMNCLKNRNKHQQNEGFLMTAGIWVLKKIVFHLVMKAIKKYGSQIDFSKVMDSVANGLAEQKGALQKAIGKAVNGWNDLPEKYKNQITELAKEKFNELKSAAGEKINQLTSKAQPQLANQEQEEEDYTNDEIPSPNFSYRMSFMVWAMREIIPYLKEISQVCAQADPTELKHAVMKILKTRDTGIPETPRSCKEWAKQNYDWVEMDLNGEYDAYQEKWSKPFNIPSEQEETTDEKSEFALKLVKKFKNKMTPDYAKRPEMFMMLKLQKALKKPLMSLSKEEYRAWAKAICDACDSVFGATQEQEEHSEDYDRLQSQLANAWDEGMEDDEDDYVPYNNTFDETHHDIVDTILDEVYRYFQFETDVEGFNLTEYTDEQIGKAIEQILDKTDDFPSSVSNNVCYAWVKKYAEELMKILETGSLENTYEGHPEFDFSEQEEMPQMERHDIILALTQYLDESWIDADEDGDLDELYYAVAEVLDKTGDYPASTDWEDCKPWCQKHYREVEETFLGGGF